MAKVKFKTKKEVDKAAARQQEVEAMREELRTTKPKKSIDSIIDRLEKIETVLGLRD